MKINVHGGHNFKVCGAKGFLDETKEDRNVKNLVIEKLRFLGHEVYDCTDEDGSTQSKNLSNIVKKCNSHKVDLDISIHFNASNGVGHGVEVLVYRIGNTATKYATNIVNNISKLGYTNRGVKERTNLYVLSHTNSPALLIECCFCDNQGDANIYNAVNMANAIVEGITGNAVVTPTPTPQPTPKPVETPKPVNNGDEWVKALQNELNKQYNSSLVVDGIGGSRTLGACPTVRKGAKGNITKLIQQRLNSVGFNLVCDGDFGNNTKKAIEVFQRNRGLSQDGIVGKNTWSWLLKGARM